MKKILLSSLGWICVGLGFIGIFVPGIPTTIFLIIALWAFSNSSKYLHDRLLNHRKFGPILRAWNSHKVVPRKAKVTMVVLQTTAVILFHRSFQDLYLTIGLILVLLAVAGYVLALPSKIPDNA